MAVQLWGRHIRDTFVKTQAQEPLVCYACQDDDGLTVFVINKGPDAVEADIFVHGYDGTIRSALRYGGRGPQDTAPALAEMPVPGQGPVELAPCSVTVLEFSRP